MQCSAVQLLLNFIYYGATEVPQDELEDLMALAATLEIRVLLEGSFARR